MHKMIRLQMQDMTPQIMQSLEEKGLIIRLSPGKYEVDAPEGEVGIEEIYRTDEQYGSHMLIAATINRSQFSAFATHPENEDVFLIGDAQVKPMCFLFALCNRAQFQEKVSNHTLSEIDFIALRAKYNDVEVSCFTIIKNIPHGEAVMAGDGKPPTFFVTEQTRLPLDLVDFGDYQIVIDNMK